jgi:hypothetical protein
MIIISKIDNGFEMAYFNSKENYWCNLLALDIDSLIFQAKIIHGIDIFQCLN